MESSEKRKLTDLINEFYFDLLDCDIEYDKKALLQAIAQVESSYGVNNIPRFEPSYYIDGYYYKVSTEVQNYVSKYGKHASCSYSSFQIMFPTACELGYTGTPQDLGKDEIAIQWVIKFINNRILRKKPQGLEDIFDAYNSGNFKDKYIPERYIKKATRWYDHYVLLHEKYVLEQLKKEEENTIVLYDDISFKYKQLMEFKRENTIKRFFRKLIFWRYEW